MSGCELCQTYISFSSKQTKCVGSELLLGTFAALGEFRWSESTGGTNPALPFVIVQAQDI